MATTPTETSMKSNPDADRARTWVLVLNYQGREHIAGCLRSLGEQIAPPGGSRCVVIDNASTDGSLELVRDEFPKIDIIQSDVNRGFAGGNNLGIRHAIDQGAEYVALLNMDTRVDPRWLHELVTTADSLPSTALLGSRILSADGQTVEFDGLQFDTVTTSGGYAEYSAEQSEAGIRDAFYACGAAVLMRVGAVQSAGLFDESFFAYHEDVELAIRCRRAGYRVVNVGSSVVYHVGGGAGAGVRFRDFMGTRNLILTLFKHYDRATWHENYLTLLHHFINQDEPLRLQAMLAALFHAPAALRQRRRISPITKHNYSELRSASPGCKNQGPIE